MNFEANRSALDEWKNSGTVVLAAFCGFFFVSMIAASLSMFIEPVSHEFNWSRTFVSIGFTIASATTALLSPLFGFLIDRYGSRRVALPGIVITSLAVAAFSTTNGSTAQWIILWLVYATVSISVKTTVWTASVATEFRVSQGLALGLTLCGAAAAQAILPPIINWVIADFGWRTAYIALGVVGGTITFTLCFLFLRRRKPTRPAETGAAPDAVAPAPRPGLEISQAWRCAALWSIAGSTFIIMLLTLGLTVHQIPILTEAGVSRTQAAWLTGLSGLAAIVGKLVAGVLLDRFRPNWVAGVTLAATALAFGLLLREGNSLFLIVLAMLINGYTQGTKLQFCAYLTSRYAGMRNFGSVFGFMNSVIALGSGLGPVIAGSSYDLNGNYDYFLMAGVLGSIISGLLLVGLPAYPDWNEQAARVDAEA